MEDMAAGGYCNVEIFVVVAIDNIIYWESLEANRAIIVIFQQLVLAEKDATGICAQLCTLAIYRICSLKILAKPFKIF